MITRSSLAICGALACSPLCANTQARHWEALYAFGDSYTDSGAGYLDANGPTAVVYLAANLQIPFTHANSPESPGKSLNFAVSDAKTGSSGGYRVRPAAADCRTRRSWPTIAST